MKAKAWIAISILTTSNLAFAQVPWLAAVNIASSEAQKRVCSLEGVPGGIAAPKPASDWHRQLLYLRCEAKGGRDEFTSNSCCDHLTPSAANGLSVCPDRPTANVVVPIREAYRQLVRC